MSIAQDKADNQRAEAKQLLLNSFGINDGESNGTVERIVDCIIGAALLEMAAIQEEAVSQTHYPPVIGKSQHDPHP